jgi:hypothetical protein
MNRRDTREIIFAQAVERGGTKPSPEARKTKRRSKNAQARKARRANRGR